jgi:DNA uptake protein ComE-like DNA-binding protein
MFSPKKSIFHFPFSIFPGRRHRRASVLILVVALLVLMALIGTAYISSTRIERYTSNQNASNTQADLLFQGLVKIVSSTLSGNLYGTATTSSQYRPPASFVQLVSNYGNYTNTFNEYTNAFSDLFLADRIPSLNVGAPVWASVSWPLFPPTGATYAFDLPNGIGANTQINIGTVDIKSHYLAYPGTIQVGGQTFPAMAVYDSTTAGYLLPTAPGFAAVTSPTPTWFLAADADGDGIADSGLWKLPVSPINGITYYAAVRIVDNNAAFNVNTAISNVSDFSAVAGAPVDAMGAPVTLPTITPPQNLGTFPSHVGLMQILTDYNTGADTSSDMIGALQYIFQNTSPPVSSTPAGGWDQAYPDTTPRTARADFTFTTVGDNLSSQLVRRLANPGYFTAALAYQPFLVNDGAALAYRFCLRNASASLSTLETKMPNSLVIPVASIPYGAGDITNWFNTNFNYTLTTPRPARSLIVTSNPVADFIPAHSVTNGTVVEPLNPRMLPYHPPVYDKASASYVPGSFVQYAYPASAKPKCYEALTTVAAGKEPIDSTNGTPDVADWREEPWTETSTKVNINTATFTALWRAFYNVMADTDATGDSDTVPAPPAAYSPQPVGPMTYAITGWGPFRSSARNTAVSLTAGQMLQLRSAIAAVNAMDMRDSDDDISSRTFTIYTDKTHTIAAYDVTVFGLEKQPFITKVVADFDGTATTQISIELYNPTDTAIDLTNWRLGTFDPSAASLRTITVLPPFAAAPPPVIPAGGYLILQGAGGANITPAVAEISVAVPGLESAGTPGPGVREVVLLRPRRADAGNIPSASNTFDNTFDEGSVATPNPDQMVPVDMTDFTGVFVPGPSGRRVYERPNGSPSPATSGNNWQFVYPGAYDLAAAATPRQTGWGAFPGPITPIAGGTASDGTTAGGNNPVVFPPIQLATSNWVGPNNTSGAVPYHFPFGGFPRNGDMLKVPFIGAYVIRTAGTVPTIGGTFPFVAMNSITMDAAMADCQILTARSDEALGRFCPLAAINPSASWKASNGITDPYRWASRIFDYLDVQVANDDFYPNVDPAASDATTIPNPRGWKYPNNVAATASTALPVSNALASTNGTSEQSLGKQGLININTAPSYVLQQLPGVSQQMALAIVAYRQTNGPFRSIFDLNLVGVGAGTAEFQTRGGTYKLTMIPAGGPPPPPAVPDNLLADDPGTAEGDFTPDSVRDDFEERTLMINRISNLITTRSDSFTCYVLLQGWRGVGTASPTLAVQRRSAFFLDRTTVTPTNSNSAIFNIPGN